MDHRPNMYSVENSTNGGFNSGAGNSHIPQRPTRRRGRPKGSKNKPKAVQPLLGKSPKPMRETIIHITPGSDVVRWLFQFCCSHKVLLTVLRGSGFLFDVILHGNRRTIAGPVRLESLSGTFRPVPPPSSESCFQLKVILQEAQGPQLYDHMVRGKAANLVTVEAVMTRLSKNPVQRVTSDDWTKNTVIGTSSSSNNLPPRSMNTQFCESYKSATSHHMNNPVKIDHQEHNQMMSSSSDDLMAIVTSERSVGTERAMPVEIMAEIMNSTWAELNKKLENIGLLISDSAHSHNQKETETDHQEHNLIMNSSCDDLMAVVNGARRLEIRTVMPAVSKAEMKNSTWAEVNKKVQNGLLISNSEQSQRQKETETSDRMVGRESMMAATAAGSTMEMVTMNKTALSSSEINSNAHIKEYLSNTSEVHNDIEKSLTEEDTRMEMKSNNDDELWLNDDFWGSFGEGDELFEDDSWNSLGVQDDKEKKKTMEFKNDGLFDDDFWKS